MKRFLAVLSALLASFAAASISSAQQTPPLPANTIFVASSTAKAGETVDISVWAGKQNTAFNGIEFLLKFTPVSPEGLSSLPTGVEGGFKVGSVFPASAIWAVNTDTPGEVRVAIAAAQAINGPGPIATVAVRVPSDISTKASYLVEIREVILSDESGNDVTQATLINGTLDVEAGGPPVVKGDLSGDGLVRVNDATKALRIAVNIDKPTERDLKAGDVNGDGKITVLDVTLILRAALGLIKL